MDSALSPDELQAWQASMQRVREATVRAARAPDAPRPAAVVRWLHQGLDQVWAGAQLRGAKLACQAGCAACCSAPVEVAHHEARELAQHVRDLPKSDRARLKQRLAAWDAAWLRAIEAGAETDANTNTNANTQYAAPEGQTAWADRPPCVLLDESGRCGVYERRPAVCRKGHSLDVSACHTRGSDLPQDLALLLDSEALILGVEAATHDLGWGGARRPLIDVVRAALEPED